jgi:hypothetical protein
MLAVPPDIAAATPVVVFILATALLLLLQVPPAGELLRVAALPAHTGVKPEMAEGSGCTVKTAVAEQPLML